MIILMQGHSEPAGVIRCQGFCVSPVPPLPLLPLKAGWNMKKPRLAIRDEKEPLYSSTSGGDRCARLHKSSISKYS